jgi:beta-glucosidase
VAGAVRADGSAGANVTLTVANVGAAAGAEVVQLYLAHPPALGEPPKVLVAFAKVAVPAGGAAGVAFSLTAADVAVFDVVSDGFVAVPGRYGVLAAASAADVRLAGEV